MKQSETMHVPDAPADWNVGSMQEQGCAPVRSLCCSFVLCRPL